MRPCFLGLGANLGEPRRQLESAVEALEGLRRCRLLSVSPVYRSAPLGPRDQPDYLNAAARLDTELSPHDLLTTLQALETAAGRVRGRRWGPRTLDLDLLLYGRERMETPDLTLPHPGIPDRMFVLQPLIDLCGRHFRLPCGAELGTLLDSCPGPAPERQRWTLKPPGDGVDRDRDRDEGGAQPGPQGA